MTASGKGTTLGGAAADDGGFGVIGTVSTGRTELGFYGSPVFMRFQVVH